MTSAVGFLVEHVSLVSLDLSVPLQRAARAEQEKIRALVARIDERLAALDDERAQLRDERARLRERDKLLAQIIDPDTPASTSRSSGVVLRGARLRLEAGRLLVQHFGAGRPVHYRDWYDLLREAGFVVLGKRPTAAFLTAVSRSPLVRRADEPGVYYIDPGAVPVMKARLAEVDAELADLEQVLMREATPDPGLRQHRVGLLAQRRRLQGNVDESEAVLDVPAGPSRSEDHPQAAA